MEKACPEVETGSEGGKGCVRPEKSGARQGQGEGGKESGVCSKAPMASYSVKH